MHWLSAYEEDLRQSFNEAERILGGLPAPFSEAALLYLDKFHALKENRSKNYICYLLPFWLHKSTAASLEDCQRIAVANIFGMMYYHLIDETMDEPEQQSAIQLPLANLIHYEFTTIYSSYFPPASPFWNYFKKYLTEWAQAVTHEKQGDYFYENPKAIAHKASPVKLSIASLILLAQSDHSTANTAVPLLENGVDTVLITLQMLDDWQDWKKDLIEGSYNCLISLVQSESHIPKERRPTTEEISQAIFTSELMQHYVGRAVANHESLANVVDYAPELYEFHKFLCQDLQKIADNIEKERNLLYKGGLAHWLAKNNGIC